MAMLFNSKVNYNGQEDMNTFIMWVTGAMIVVISLSGFV